MNLCILQGKVISETEFKFIINNKNKSIAYFDMELSNKSIVRIKSYNDMADYIYRKINIHQILIIEGKVREDGTIECINVQSRKLSNDFC